MGSKAKDMNSKVEDKVSLDKVAVIVNEFSACKRARICCAGTVEMVLGAQEPTH